MPELKEITDKMQNIWEQMKSTMDESRKEMAAVGHKVAETETKIDRMGADLDAHKKTLDDLGLKMARQNLILPGQPVSEEQKAKRAAFFKWLRVGKKDMEPGERKALVEDATGLVMVPEDLEATIIRALPGLTVMRNLCTIRPTNRDKIRARSLTEVSVGWGKLETGTAVTEATMTPASGYVYVEDLYGLTKVGEDELQDTDANLVATIADSFVNAIAAAEEAAFAVGAGHAVNQPSGITVDSTLIAGLVAGGGPANTITYGKFWATDDTVLWNDVLAVEYMLPAQYRQGACWLMNQSTEGALRLLVSNNQYLWQPGLTAGMPHQIDGYPVYNNSSMLVPSGGATGINCLFGNFKQGYVILDRQGMALQRLDELYSEAGLVGFKAHFRVGGAVIRPDAFRFVCNDAT